MSTRASSAFTLIELVTVVVILAVISSLLVPRVVSWGERRAGADAERVTGMLSAAARGHLYSTRRLAIDFDRETGQLRLLTLGAGASFDAEPAWLENPLTPPVTMEQAEITGVSADGRALDPGRFRIELPPAEARPAITVRLIGPRGSGTWTVHLATSGERANLTTGQEVIADDRVDLDAAGLRDEAW